MRHDTAHVDLRSRRMPGRVVLATRGELDTRCGLGRSGHPAIA